MSVHVLGAAFSRLSVAGHPLLSQQVPQTRSELNMQIKRLQCIGFGVVKINCNIPRHTFSDVIGT